MAGILLTATPIQGIETTNLKGNSMLQSNSMRLRQCRNTPAISDRGYTHRIVELRAPNGSPEKCELAFAQNISTRLQDSVLVHGDLFCQRCGVIPGDIDHVTGRKAKFNIEYIVNKSIDGKEELSSLRTLCSTCNQGAKNITTEKPTGLWLLSQVRRAGQDEQLAVLNWLREKFKD